MKKDFWCTILVLLILLIELLAFSSLLSNINRANSTGIARGVYNEQNKDAYLQLTSTK